MCELDKRWRGFAIRANCSVRQLTDRAEPKCTDYNRADQKARITTEQTLRARIANPRQLLMRARRSQIC